MIEEIQQKPSSRDDSRMWWENGLKDAEGGMAPLLLNIQTGYYGLSVEPDKGGVVRMGAMNNPRPGSGSMQQLPPLTMDYRITCGEQRCPLEKTVSPEGSGNCARLLESGRFVQRMDLMYLAFQGTNIIGRLELCCTTRFCMMILDVYSREEKKDVRLDILIRQPRPVCVQEPTRLMTMGKEDGLAFLAPKPSGAAVYAEDGRICLSSGCMDIPKGKWTGFSIAVIPYGTMEEGMEKAADFRAAENLQISAEQLSPNPGVRQKAGWDGKFGYGHISLSHMFEKMLSEADTFELQNQYDRLRFTIRNSSGRTIAVPIRFTKDYPLSVTGFSPLLRDARTGEPIGVPVQLSKNWHRYSLTDNWQIATQGKAPDDPARYFEGVWFHGYTLLAVPGNGSVTCEYTCPFAQWGGVYTVSHSQLCLVGWGGNQQWETAALGSFGETFCHDIQQAWTACVLGDICPALVNSRVNGGKYDWTINVGGADFLVYYPKGGGKMPYAAMKTNFRKQGPNLTEVLYEGVTADGKIRMEYSAVMGRTDDASKIIHSFSYTFLEDVEYDRLAFYSFGADSYNVGYYDTLAVGDAAGLAPFTLGGGTYDGQMPIPKTSDNRYYLSDGMQHIPAREGLWFAFLGGKPNPGTIGAAGNRLLTVLEYDASINGKTHKSPCFNIRTTFVHEIDGALTELAPPDCGGVIRKGSTVKGKVQFINLPVHKEDYYGDNPFLLNLEDGVYDTAEMAYRYAQASKISVMVESGRLKQLNPPVMWAEPDGCRFRLSGGVGYVPVTIAGLHDYRGWRLQKEENGCWKNVDQSVHGNDYWQCLYDGEFDSYELTYNIPCGLPGAEGRYRLTEAL